MAPTRSLSTAQAAARLTRGDASWADGLGQPTVITYAYRASIPAGYLGSDNEASSFQKFTAHQIQMTELILDLFEEVSGVKMQRVSGANGYSNNATFLLANYADPTQSSTYAYSYSVGNADRSAGSLDGDFWYNLRGPNDDGGPPLMPVGSDNYTTVLHEIGHSFGLDHPTDYPDDFNYDRDAYYIQDSLQYSVMSYFPASATGANYGGAFPRTLLLHDIAAVQRLYGANMTVRTGNDTYGFGGKGVYAITGVSEKAVFCVWDAGGKDTLNLSKYTNTQTIDLNAEHFSSTGGLKWNMSIAKGVVIENAVGGSGKDLIIGNGAANALLGGGGDDTLTGGNGNDALTGGAGKDVLNGGAGSDTASYADKALAVSVALNGSVTVTVLVNGIAEDKIVNIENLLGGLGNDTLTGDSLANVLNGNGGNDTLTGGAGQDILIGGLGNDRLVGGTEADIFRFTIDPSDGSYDTVVDFVARSDKIQLSGAVFVELGGVIDADTFDAVASGNAGDSDDLVIYDKSTGRLWYDADSYGDGEAMLIAQLGTKTFHTTTLAYTDFAIV